MAAQDPNASTESNSDVLVLTSIVLLILTWLSVFLRTYVRAIMLKGFQADDWLMLISQGIFTVSCIFIFVGVYYGLGRHNLSLDQFDEIKALEYQALATASYVMDMMFIKLSIGIFLLRLATQKRYKYTIYASLVVIAVWSLVLFFWNLFQCHPLQAQWDYTILLNDPNAGCVSPDAIVSAAYALSVMTILSDWMYAIIPIPIVWHVKMTTQAKLTVSVILGLGVFASIATIIRLKYLADLTDTADILFAATDAMVWTLVEPGVAIIASSLVTIRPLLRAWKIKGFGTTERSRTLGATGSMGRQGHSRTNKSNGSKMPGFGSMDVTLTDNDLELGQHSKHSSFHSAATSDFGTTTSKSGRSRLSYMSRISEASAHQYSPDGSSKKVPVKVRTESFMTDEGSITSPTTAGGRTPGSPRYNTQLRTPPKSWFESNSPSSSQEELAARDRQQFASSQANLRTGLEPSNQI